MKNRFRAAATLTELLIVITFLMMVMGISGVIFFRSIDEGKKSADLAKLSQIGKAFALYSADHEIPQYDLDVLVASAYLPKAVVKSNVDDSPLGRGRVVRQKHGAGDWRRKQDAKIALDRTFRRSFASLNDFGFDLPHVYKKIAEEPRLGWCINPSYITDFDREIGHWNGYYQRLLMDGAVITTRVQHYSIDGGKLTTPLSFFADVQDQWLRNFMGS